MIYSRRIFLCVLCGLIFISCGVHKNSAYTDFETKCIGTELDGSYTLRASGRARNAADAYVQAGKQAVQDVLFTIIPCVSGVSAQSAIKPLLTEVNAKEKYESFFAKFFADNGEYLKFMSMKEKRIFSSRYSKTNTQTVCVTTVCVDRIKLKEYLRENGILK
ncbi:MAG: hypothetical protein ACI392_07920 [Paludibacteraceae bacterium]